MRIIFDILGLIILTPFYILLYISVFFMKSDSDLARESYEVRI